MKQIVAYSLWCQDKPMDGYTYQTHTMYCNGAIRNVEIQKEKGIYKDWTFRYYINNTVPKEVKDRLIALGGELVDMTGSKIPGMFWRFLPFEDNTVHIFVVRDTDSRINEREEIAVSAWIDSKKLLHVMRDHPHHFYKILGGMWGYRNDLRKVSIIQSMHQFLQQRNYHFTRMDDMKFLDHVYALFEKKRKAQFFIISVFQSFFYF